MNWKKLTLLALVILGSWFGWKTFFASKANTTPQYQTAQVERGTLIQAVAVSGTASNQGTTVNTSATGTVSKVLVKNGDTVKPGQVLFSVQLDDAGQQNRDSAYASYLAAKNSLAAAQAKMNSLQATLFKANQTFLNDKGADPNPITTDPNYIQENATWLQAEADYKNQSSVIAQAQVALSASWLSYKQTGNTITAPTGGVISGLSVQAGSLLVKQTSSSTIESNSQQVAIIRSSAAPTIAVNLTEIDVPKVHVGNKVSVTFDALPDKTYTGLVSSINTNGQVSSNVATYPTVITLDTISSDILPNMSAAANIITFTKTDVLLIPNAAVQTQNGQSSVRTLKDGKVTNQTVEIGQASDTQTEIVSGLEEGQTVVTGTVTSSPSSTTRTGTANSPFSGGLRLGGGGGNFTRAVSR